MGAAGAVAGPVPMSLGCFVLRITVYKCRYDDMSLRCAAGYGGEKMRRPIIAGNWKLNKTLPKQ
jgi:formiminotetrahydrofolate cyclodeaminase